MRTSVLLLASGESARMRASGVQGRKVWLPLAGATVLEHALRAFEAVDEVAQVVLVVHPEDLERARRVAATSSKPACAVAGGAQRMDSARAGLAAADASCALVAVHDAARPLVEPAAVRSAIAAAARSGAAIAASRVVDTIKRSADGLVERETVDRAQLWAAQTPQVFELARYAGLVARAAEEGWTPTDDAALWERWIGPVALVEGGAHNRKLTTAADLLHAEAVLAARAASSKPDKMAEDGR